MVVGQSPGLMEDQSGTPFQGQHGQLLGLILDQARIPRNGVYRTYAVRCASKGFTKPKRAEVEACRDYLIEEIRAVQPDVIITMGETALMSLYGVQGHDTYDTDVQNWDDQCRALVGQWELDVEIWREQDAATRKAMGGKPKKPKLPSKPKKPKTNPITVRDVLGHTLVQPDTGIPLVPTYMPAYLMRDRWEHTELVVEHFAKAKRIADGTQSVGTLGSYATIADIDELRALRDYLLQADVIAYDTETTGLKWMRDELMCISFSTQAGEGFVVPILHNAGTDIPELYPPWNNCINEVIDILIEIFGSDTPKLAQNALFDMRMLERYHDDPHIIAATAFGLRIDGELRDTELLHHAVKESFPHNMTNLLALYTDMPYYEDNIKQYKKMMWKAPNDLLWAYSAADADGLFRIWENLRPIAEDEGTDWVLDNITMPMLRFCRDMEDRGFPINVDYFDRLCEFYDTQILLAEQDLWDAVPHRPPESWKYNHPGTLQEVLFKELRLKPSTRKTPSARGCGDCSLGVCFKHLSTGKDALDDMIREGSDHPALHAIKRLKFLTKRKSTYLDGGKGGFKQWIQPDDRIHATQKISRVETGRLASENPNDKNIPNYVHIHPSGGSCTDSKCDAFYDEAGWWNLDTTNAFHDSVEARPGYGIMNADWAQLEIWVLAYRLAKEFHDTTLLDVLKSGVDIHMWMARQMFPELDPELSDDEWRKVHPELRRRAKTADFGIGYGLTTNGFMAREHCTEEEAQTIIDRYKKVVPIEKYFKSIRQQLYNHGYVENEFGRRRHITHLGILKAMAQNDRRILGVLDSAIREGINFPIQSGGSDLHSYASAEINRLDALKKRNTQVILSVHDSLSFEFEWKNEASALKTAWIIKNTMEDIAKNMLKPDGTKLDWEVPVEVEWGQKWGSPMWKIDAGGQYGPI